MKIKPIASLFKLHIVFFSILLSISSYSFPVIEKSFSLGYTNLTQNSNDFIDITGLIGDRFNAIKRKDSNVILGANAFVPLSASNTFKIGFSAFYIGSNKASGNITQELLFTNLAYEYKSTHLPIYGTLKSNIKINNNYDLWFDCGIGLDIVKTHGYKESSLDGGVTIPNNVFLGKSSTGFASTIGLGFRKHKVYKNIDSEIGYRFLNLAKGSFNTNSNIILNNLSTGPSYAHSLIFTLIG